MDVSNVEKLLHLLNTNKREAIVFDFVETEEDDPYTSKLGGTPYLPVDFDYPTTLLKGETKNLAFMCQINLHDVFKQVGSSLLPPQGILQFYILTEYCFGDALGTPNHQLFKIIYHDHIGQHTPCPELLNKIQDNEYTDIINGIFTMQFSKKMHTLDPTDYLSAQQILGDETINHGYAYNALVRHFIPDIYDIPDDALEHETINLLYDLSEEHNNEPHHLFGFVYFQQSEYLDINKETLDKNYVCLLQFSPFDEMFDCSINVRIPEQDLINLQFDNAIINMDCT